MNFEQLLKSYPHWSAWGVDDTGRPGFRNSRRILEEAKADFDIAVAWLEQNEIRSHSSLGVRGGIERATRRAVCHGALCLAIKALAIPVVIRGNQLQFI